MNTTDVLLVVTIVLLLVATGVSINGEPHKYSEKYPVYNRHSCNHSCRGKHNLNDVDYKKDFAKIKCLDDSYIEDNDVDEMCSHPKSRGLAPKSIYTKNNTQNYWKTQASQPDADDLGRYHTSFSSDLVTPYKNQHSLLGVNPDMMEVKHSPFGSTIFEKSSVEIYGESDNPLDNE